MNNIVFVFPSTSEKDPKALFSGFTHGLDYDVKYLSSVPKDKVLKKDIDLNMEELDEYTIICPVGAEPLKYVAGLTGITKYNGVLIENKYYPLINPNLCEFRPQYKEDIAKACTKLRRLDPSKIEENNIPKHYEHITTLDRFIEYFRDKLEKAMLIVADIETTSLSCRKGEIIGVAFSTQAHEGVFVDSAIIKQCIPALQEVFDKAIIIFHNGKFDMQWMEYEYGFVFNNFEDTMLIHYLLNEAVGTHGLKPLALQFTDLGDYERELDTYKKEFCRKNKILLRDFNYGLIPIDMLAPYACKDGDGTMQLYGKFKPLIDKNEKFIWLYENLLKPAVLALKTLEGNGGPIDFDAALALSDDYEIDIEECTEEIMLDNDVQRFERLEGKDFNPNSTAHLRKVLFEYKKLTPIKKTEGGAWSVDKEVLTNIDNPLTEIILELREKVKIKGTYLKNIINGIDYDRRLRSSFNITGTTSGRLSSSGVINYQNIPRDNKDIKKLFRAREGYTIVQGDLGTAEVYVAAVLSNDKFLKQAFIDKLDFHSYVAKQMFNIPIPVNEIKEHPIYSKFRQYAKAITFGIMYQAGPAKVAETVNTTAGIAPEDMITREEAVKFINKYFSEARNLKRFIDESNGFIKNNAYIYSFFGRKRRLIESTSHNRSVAQHAIRSGVNFLVQSVASDINLLGFIDAMNWIAENNYQKDIIPFTIVHDSIVAEVKNELLPVWIETLTAFIQKDRGVSIPNCPIGFDIEVGPSWGELKKYAA